MKASRAIILSAIFSLLCISGFAQFTLSGEIRPRGEFRKGYKLLSYENSDPSFLVSQRSRIIMGYNTGKLKTKISFQDVRVWGDELYKTDVPGIGIYEAWAEIPLCDSLSIRAGKQELVYDNERLLTRSNFSQLGITHNAALLSYKKNSLQVDFAAAFNQSAEQIFGTDYTPLYTNYKTLNFLWVSKKIKGICKASLLAIADGYQKEGTTNTTYLRGTIGGILEKTKENKYSFAVRGFYQTGRLQTGQEIAAYYGSADISHTFNEKYTVLAGIEYISGKDALDTANKKNNAFSTLYGSCHTFDGNMDYFSNIPKDTKGAGLINPYLYFILKLGEKSQFRADFHYFLLQNNYLINGSPIDKALGAEADLSYSYDISKEVNVLAGFSIINPAPSMEVFFDGNSGYYGTWGFVMLTVKPTFFRSEKK